MKIKITHFFKCAYSDSFYQDRSQIDIQKCKNNNTKILTNMN